VNHGAVANHRAAAAAEPRAIDRDFHSGGFQHFEADTIGPARPRRTLFTNSPTPVFVTRWPSRNMPLLDCRSSTHHWPLLKETSMCWRLTYSCLMAMSQVSARPMRKEEREVAHDGGHDIVY
jgi:hypothetical protein